MLAENAAASSADFKNKLRPPTEALKTSYGTSRPPCKARLDHIEHLLFFTDLVICEVNTCKSLSCRYTFGHSYTPLLLGVHLLGFESLKAVNT